VRDGGRPAPERTVGGDPAAGGMPCARYPSGGILARRPTRSLPSGRMASGPLFADDNSSYRRAMRRAESEARAREERRQQILATLRRLREKAQDPAALAAEERAARHRAMLERYPPLY